MSEELKKQLTTTLGELFKASSQWAKLIVAADNHLQASSNIKEVELLDLSLSKLRQVGEEAEEIQSHWHFLDFFMEKFLLETMS